MSCISEDFWPNEAKFINLINAGAGMVMSCDPPVRFRRAAGMFPLPVPEAGGSIEALGPFLNLPNQTDFVLVVAWLLATLRSAGPYP